MDSILLPSSISLIITILSFNPRLSDRPRQTIIILTNNYPSFTRRHIQSSKFIEDRDHPQRLAQPRRQLLRLKERLIPPQLRQRPRPLRRQDLPPPQRLLRRPDLRPHLLRRDELRATHRLRPPLQEKWTPPRLAFSPQLKTCQISRMAPDQFPHPLKKYSQPFILVP